LDYGFSKLKDQNEFQQSQTTVLEVFKRYDF